MSKKMCKRIFSVSEGIDRQYLYYFLRSVECEKIHDICQAVYGMKHPSNELEGLYLADKIWTLHQEGKEYRDIAVFYRLQKQAEILEKMFAEILLFPLFSYPQYPSNIKLQFASE